MGSGEDGTPTKSSKPASSLQETSSAPTTPVYPDWSSSMQAFYGPGATPPFFAPPVGSSTPHPFLWGGQHPLMPPYGTPVYPAMYPPGGVYAHPSMVMNPGNIHGTAELDGKANERKDSASIKTNKGTSGNNGSIGARTGDGGKAASGSGNDVGTQSGESGSEEGSSDASDDNNQDFSKTKKGSFDQMLMDGANAQNNSVPSNLQPLAARNSVASVPPTNLNIGMDLWNASQAGSGPMPSHPNQNVPPHVAPSGMDERELKRQKRKQSNRESARRSRLRKQAECEELQHRVEMLSNENHTLRDELRRLSEECEKLTSENNSIKAELVRLYGPEAVSKLEDNNPTADDGQSHDENGN